MDPFIKQLKNRLKAKKFKGLALDIDDTLAKTGDFWISALIKKFGNPEKLTIEQIQEKYRYSYNAPYWDSDEVKAWEKSVRHNDKLHRNFPLIKNANHIVEKINQIVPIVTYLTARAKTVIPGTRIWLNKHDFPQVDIIYRPKRIKLPVNLAWKAEVLEYLYPQVTGIVDDHPQLAKELSKNYQGIFFYYDYSGQSPRDDIKVIPCKTWQDVLEKVKALA